MVPKVAKNHPKSEQNGALGSHGTPLGDVLGQKGPRGGHKAPIVAAMVAQRSQKGAQMETKTDKNHTKKHTVCQNAIRAGFGCEKFPKN